MAINTDTAALLALSTWDQLRSLGSVVGLEVTNNDRGDASALMRAWPEDLYLRPSEILQLPLTLRQQALLVYLQLERQFPGEVASLEQAGQNLGAIFHVLAQKKGPAWLMQPREVWWPDSIFGRMQDSHGRLHKSAEGPRAEIDMHAFGLGWITLSGHDGKIKLFDADEQKFFWSDKAQRLGIMVSAFTAGMIPREMTYEELPPNFRRTIRRAVELSKAPPRLSQPEPLWARDFRQQLLEKIDNTDPQTASKIRLEKARAAIEASYGVGQTDLAILAALARTITKSTASTPGQ